MTDSCIKGQIQYRIHAWPWSTPIVSVLLCMQVDMHDLYFMKYEKRMWYAKYFFYERSSLRHVIGFKRFKTVKRLKNTALGGWSLRERGMFDWCLWLTDSKRLNLRNLWKKTVHKVLGQSSKLQIFVQSLSGELVTSIPSTALYKHLENSGKCKLKHYVWQQTIFWQYHLRLQDLTILLMNQTHKPFKILRVIFLC